MTTTPSLPPSWLETISHSARAVGQAQALQTYRPSIREASITTAWLASDWIQLYKTSSIISDTQIKIALPPISTIHAGCLDIKYIDCHILSACNFYIQLWKK